MSKIFSKGVITGINKDSLEIHLEDKRAIIVFLYNPKKLYKVDHIEVGFKVSFLYDTKDKTLQRYVEEKGFHSKLWNPFLMEKFKI